MVFAEILPVVYYIQTQGRLLGHPAPEYTSRPFEVDILQNKHISLQNTGFFLHQEYHSYLYLMYFQCPIYSTQHLISLLIEFSYASALRTGSIIKNEVELSMRRADD